MPFARDYQTMEYIIIALTTSLTLKWDQTHCIVPIPNNSSDYCHAVTCIRCEPVFILGLTAIPPSMVGFLLAKVFKSNLFMTIDASKFNDEVIDESKPAIGWIILIRICCYPLY